MKNALVTGATKGIGRATCIALAQKGYNIIACARDERALAELALTIEGFGVKAYMYKADFSVLSSVKEFLKDSLFAVPVIDVLVNNVGVFYPGSMLDEDDDVFFEQLNVNLNAAYLITKTVGKTMREGRSGHIFNICSVASKTVVENAGSYSVTKAAMLSLNNVFRKELAAHNVKVTAIIPGATYTASWQGTTLDQKLFVQAEDVAKAITDVLLMSPNANVDELVITPLDF